MTREETIEQLKFMLEQMPEEPPLECDYIEEWLDTDRKIRSAFKTAIKIIEQEPILDKIRAEIEKQEKWLMQAGCNAYNVDIAFNSIKLALEESEDKE